MQPDSIAMALLRVLSPVQTTRLGKKLTPLSLNSFLTSKDVNLVSAFDFMSVIKLVIHSLLFRLQSYHNIADNRFRQKSLLLV